MRERPRADAEARRGEHEFLPERAMTSRRTIPVVIACASASIFAFGAARADEPLPPIPVEQARPASSPYLLSGDRFLEANVGATLQLDWNGLAAVNGPTAHAGLVLGGEVGLPFVDQRVRPAVFTGAKLGAWADEVHGPFAFVEGARLRVSPWMWDVFDVYGVLRADFDLDPGASPVFRPGLGVGLRAARLLAVEATWDVTLPLGSTFNGTKYPKAIPYGISFGALFDACFNCNRVSASPTNRDLACTLYGAAAGVKDPVRADICSAIPKAMSAHPDPQSAAREEDGMKTFLESLLAEVKGDGARAKVRALVDLHSSLLARWREYEQRMTAAAQHAQRLTEQWNYVPVPTELRAYFGCDVDPVTHEPFAAPTCKQTSP